MEEGKGFGLAPIVREGGIADPRDFTWECDLDKCKQCRAKYDNWMKAFLEEQAQFNAPIIRG